MSRREIAPIAATGSDERTGYVADAALRVSDGSGVAADVGFAWLLLTEYELQMLTLGQVEETVQTQANRLIEELAVKLQRNAEREGSEPLQAGVRTDRGGLEQP